MDINDLGDVFIYVKGLEAKLAELKPAVEETNTPEKIDDVIRAYANLREVHDILNAASKGIGNMVQVWSYNTVPDKMNDAGVTTITVEGVGRVSLSTRVSCSMLDKEVGMDWLKSNGHGDLIQPTVNSSTLGAFAKSLMAEGQELPEETFKTNVATSTSLTRSK